MVDGIYGMPSYLMKIPKEKKGIENSITTSYFIKSYYKFHRRKIEYQHPFVYSSHRDYNIPYDGIQNVSEKFNQRWVNCFQKFSGIEVKPGIRTFLIHNIIF